MLEELRIRSLGVIDDATLQLGPGLTVVTGETGAGKTMVVHGLALLAGERGDAGLVRPGATGAVVEGRLAVDPEGIPARRAQEAGAVLDDGALLVTRSLAAEGGRSRAHIGGRSVPLAVLTEVTSPLVALHGQHAQQRLVGAGEQRAILDRYAGEPVQVPLESYRLARSRWQSVRAEIADIVARRLERAQEADLLRHGLAEIADVAPVLGEDVALAADVARLAHAEQLGSAAGSARRSLTGDPADSSGADALAHVVAARQALAPATGLDPDLDELAARLGEVSYLLVDCAADLASYADSVDADPERLDVVQQRQAALAGLTRKYAADVPGVLLWAERAGHRLGELDHDDDRLDVLRGEEAELTAELASLAAQVSRQRATAADRLAAAVTAEVRALAMPHAAVEVRLGLEEHADGELEVAGIRVRAGRDGVDIVELLLTPHPGAPARPIAKGASGGELSRVMLGLEVALAGADPVPTMVFDEVDAGVGGRAAVEVGRRLAALARTHQVVVVTHLPQVAAFADRHLVVVKSDDGSVTASDVSVLDDGGRVRELSRMLAGLDDTPAARDHVAELLELAEQAKSSP